MVQVLVVVIALIVLANGAYAAVAPDRWIRSRWTLPGTFTHADAESTWQRLQIRVMGLVLAVAGIGFAAAVLKLGFTDILFGGLELLVFGAVLIGSVATFIWPEQSLTHAFRQYLPNNPATRRFCLVILRFFALSVFVGLIFVVVRGLR